ncbi:hypothetical protein Tco_0694161 [Tanacetum coccineum]
MSVLYSNFPDDVHSRDLLAKIEQVPYWYFCYEGFHNTRVVYLGGLWVMIELKSSKSKSKFMKHVGVASWFRRLCNAQSDFAAKERIVWVDIEGVPLNAWTRSTFQKIGSKWGELVELEDGYDDLFARKRICIKTSQTENILESFKLIVKGKVFWARAKELFVWSPSFKDVPEKELFSDDESVKINEQANNLNNDEVENASEVVSDTYFGDNGEVQGFEQQHGESNDKEVSSDPFNIYNLLDKRTKEAKSDQTPSYGRQKGRNSRVLERLENCGQSLFWKVFVSGFFLSFRLSVRDRHLFRPQAYFTQGKFFSDFGPYSTVAFIILGWLLWIDDLVSKFSVNFFLLLMDSLWYDSVLKKASNVKKEIRAWTWISKSIRYKLLERSLGLAIILLQAFFFLVCLLLKRIKGISVADKMNSSSPSSFRRIVPWRNVSLPSLACPLCDHVLEDSSHLFFGCSVAKDIQKLICRWWNLDVHPYESYEDWLSWFKSIRLGSKTKEVVGRRLVLSFLVEHLELHENPIPFCGIIPRKDAYFRQYCFTLFLLVCS